MAVDANALNLAQYALLSNSPLVRRVVFSLHEMGSLLQDIPLVTQQTLIANGVRFAGANALPTPNWAKINEEPVVVVSTPTPFQEQLYLIRNGIDVDDKLVRDVNRITDPRAVQLQAYLRAITYTINDAFVNNSPVSGDVDAVPGIRYRLDNPTQFGCETELKIDGSGVDLSVAGMTATTANTFLETVDTLLDYMGASDGSGVVLYMNDTLKRRFARAVRVLSGSGFTTTRDLFDRAVDTYKGAVVRDIGRKLNQSTRIITSTETAAGVDGASNFTSLYGVKWGEDSMMGWQFDPLDESIRDLGKLNNGVTWRIVFDWGIGLYQTHTRAIGRIYDIKVS